jgi:hypothetical protein
VRENGGVTRGKRVLGGPLALVPRVTRVVHLRIGELDRHDGIIEGHGTKVGWAPVVRQSESSRTLRCNR